MVNLNTSANANANENENTLPQSAGKNLDFFLYTAFQNKTPVVVFLLNNHKVIGQVIGFSRYTITIKTFSKGVVYLYKSAIIMIAPHQSNFNNNQQQNGKSS